MPTPVPNPSVSQGSRGNPGRGTRSGQGSSKSPMNQKAAAKTNHPSIRAFFPSASPKDIAAQLPPNMRQQSETAIMHTNMESSPAAEDDSGTTMFDDSQGDPILSPENAADKSTVTQLLSPPPSTTPSVPANQAPTLPETIIPTFPTDMDDISDDETVANRSPDTPITIPPQTQTPKPLPAKEFNIKLLFQARYPVSANEAANRCLNVLSAIAQMPTLYPINIFDKHGNIMKKFDHSIVTSFNNHLPLLRHNMNFWTVFKIRVQIPFSAIRNNEVVFHALQSTNGRLSVHPWEPSVTNVFSLGFFVGALPMYQTEEHFTTQVKQSIASKTKIPVKDLRLHCVRSRISVPYQGVNVQCEAFDLQIRREDFTKFFDPICLTFPGHAPLKLMLYKDRYDHPAQFAKAIHLQAQFQLGHKIIAINGISSDAMFSFEAALRNTYPDIVGVLKTNTTDSKNPTNQPIGRWNVLCSCEAFPTLALRLHKNLPDMFAKFLEDEGRNPPEGAEPVCVASNFKGKPREPGDEDIQSTDGSRASYQSGWTVGLAQTNVEADIPRELLRFYAPISDRRTQSTFSTQSTVSTGRGEQSQKQKSNTYATIVSAGIPASTFVPLSPSAATTPQQSDTTISPNEHYFLQMCEQMKVLSGKIEGLETWAAKQNTQHQSELSVKQQQQKHTSAPDPAPNLTEITQVLSKLVTQFTEFKQQVYAMPSPAPTGQSTLESQFAAFLQVYSHDMASIRGQLHAKESNSTPSPSPNRKKSKNNNNQPATPPQDEGPHLSLHNAVTLPSIRPDGTPDEGDMQDEDADYDSL